MQRDNKEYEMFKECFQEIVSNKNKFKYNQQNIQKLKAEQARKRKIKGAKRTNKELVRYKIFELQKRH